MKPLFYALLLLIFVTPAQAESDLQMGLYYVSANNTVKNCTGDCAFTFRDGPSISYHFRQTWGWVGYYLDDAAGYGSAGYGLVLKAPLSFGDIGLTLGKRNTYTNISYPGTTSTTSDQVTGTEPEVGLFLSYRLRPSHNIDVRYVVSDFTRTINSLENIGTEVSPIWAPRSATFNLVRSYLYIGYAYSL